MDHVYLCLKQCFILSYDEIFIQPRSVQGTVNRYIGRNGPSGWGGGTLGGGFWSIRLEDLGRGETTVDLRFDKEASCLKCLAE
jgi:hypothetical protein